MILNYWAPPQEETKRFIYRCHGIGWNLVLNGLKTMTTLKGPSVVQSMKNQAALDRPSPNWRVLSLFYGCVCNGKDKRQKSVMQKSSEHYDSYLPIQIRCHEDTVSWKRDIRLCLSEHLCRLAQKFPLNSPVLHLTMMKTAPPLKLSRLRAPRTAHSAGCLTPGRQGRRTVRSCESGFQ